MTFALVALGIVILFTATHIVNLAYGELITIGMFGAYIFEVKLDLSFWLTLVIMSVVGAIVAVIMEAVAYKPFIARSGLHGHEALLTIFITTLALSTGVQGLLNVTTSSAGTGVPPSFQARAYSIGSLLISPSQLVTIVASLILIGLFTYIVGWTQTGRAMRGIAQNSAAAALMGVNSSTLSSAAWAASGALGAVMGVLLTAPGLVIGAYSGAPFLFIAFAGAVIGGFGSIPGAVVGCLILGLSQSMFAAYVNQQWAPLVPFVALILMLAVRPQGLFGAVQQRV
jgi:branched-chain amino acid transport system permease protein